MTLAKVIATSLALTVVGAQAPVAQTRMAARQVPTFRVDPGWSTFGGAGRWAGQFSGAHNLALNARGDLFITETYEGKRVQKFTYLGLGAPSLAP